MAAVASVAGRATRGGCGGAFSRLADNRGLGGASVGRGGGGVGRGVGGQGAAPPFSFLPQRHHGIHFSCPPSEQISSQRSDRNLGSYWPTSKGICRLFAPMLNPRPPQVSSKRWIETR